MASFYATRTQQIASNVQQHQLLKFDSRANRDIYCEQEGASIITAREAGKLTIADVWRTYRSQDAGCVFHAARYLP